eukprot:scaffold18944_cov55-Phaeocystis_antarctica.AAC.2
MYVPPPKYQLVFRARPPLRVGSGSRRYLVSAYSHKRSATASDVTIVVKGLQSSEVSRAMIASHTACSRWYIAMVVGVAVLTRNRRQSPCRSANGVYSPEATAASCVSSSCSHSCNHSK